MPAGLTGDFAGLESMIGRLEGLSDLVDEIAIESSIEIEHTIDSSFALGVDPYGEPWAPLAASTIKRHPHRAGGVPLDDTGAMRSSVVVQATQDRIEAIVADPAGYHQDGTEHMPARPILPDDARGMPPAWEAAVQDAGERVIARRFDGVSP